jgi:hypothetical protein
MKVKTIFSRYRRVIYIILLVGVCLDVLAAVRYYRNYKWAKNHPIQVYEKIRPDETDRNNIVYCKWRLFIDKKTHLPVRIEKYIKRAADANYTLLETQVITYPTDEEVKKAIKDAGF